MDLLPYSGKLAALAASMIWSCSISMYRYHGEGVPAQTLNLYKLFVAMIGFSLIVASLHLAQHMGWVASAPQFPQAWSTSFWLMLSGIIGLTLGDTLFFFAIRHLGAALTAAIQCLTPPLNVLIDRLVMNHSMTSIQLLGLAIVVLSVAGIVLAKAPKMLNAPHQMWAIGVLAAIGSAVASAIGFAITGHHVKNENIFTCNIIRFTPSFLVMLVFVLGTQAGRDGVLFLLSRPGKLFFLAMAAVLGTLIGISLLSYAFQHATTGIVSTLSTTYPIFVLPIAAIFLKEYPKIRQVILTLLAIVGIALLMLPDEVWPDWLPHG
jgi:drug/metabolite transporter (DMT)-like permease